VRAFVAFGFVAVHFLGCPKRAQDAPHRSRALQTLRIFILQEDSIEKIQRASTRQQRVA
jgi:hypothetical protein